MDPDPDPGGPKSYGSDGSGSGFGSATLVLCPFTAFHFLYFVLQEFIQAEQLKFLASGREDVDVRMLGKTQSLGSGFL